MITIDKEKGRYPAISITGKDCSLQCEHCHGYLLHDMFSCKTPEALKVKLKEFEEKGMEGALITGGCDIQGRLPWSEFLPYLKDFQTSLFLSAHSGLNISMDTAALMKETVISQALIDVIGDEETCRDIYRVQDFNIIKESLSNLYNYGPRVIPHVIVGINRGRISGEYKALEMITKFDTSFVVLVVLMPKILKVAPVEIEEVVKVFRFAKKKFKKVALGCARPRGQYRFQLEERLIEEELVDRVAIWSDRLIKKAKESGYTINYHYTCCSVFKDEI